jgi:probable HAF family extracellular repeat protein
VAFAVNDVGLIVGQSNTPGPDPYSEGGPIHACTWTNGVIKDLGTLGGADGISMATAVSSNGRIAGWTTGPTGNHACTFSGGTITDLGTISGFTQTRATGINASGTVVGLAATRKYGGNTTRAFVYSGGTIANIHDRISNLGGWTIIQLNAINDNGTIVGVGIVPASMGYGTHAIQLTPQ